LLSALSGDDTSPGVRVEARDLVSAVLDSDGRLTTSELEAWLDDIGTSAAPPVIITPQQLRESDLITGKQVWLTRPSTLFDLLVKADARDGAAPRQHLLRAGDAARPRSAAIDLVPSPDEIAAIDRFRTLLLTAMDGRRTAPRSAVRSGRGSGRATAAGTPPAGGAAAGTTDRGCWPSSTR
jgi:hypothetical protein